MSKLIVAGRIESKIYYIRGQKVMMDRDLAYLYGVSTKRLNEQVKRNFKRFPIDFMFQLTQYERDKVVANCDHLKSLKFSYQRPFVFTEQGVAMLSSVLNSERAIQVNIQIMRTFSKIRQILASHKELARKIEELEKRYDSQFKIVFDAIRELMSPTENKIKRIGFRAGD